MISFFPFGGRSKPIRFDDLLQQVSSNSASERIFTFSSLREASISGFLPINEQVDSLLRTLYECTDKPKRNQIYVLDVIQMLCFHGHHGFAEEFTQPQRIQHYSAYICQIREKSLYSAKKMAWLIQTLYSRYESPPGHFSQVVDAINAFMHVGLEAFSQDSWIPDMSRKEYYELEHRMCSKYQDVISGFQKFMDSSMASTSVQFLESSRRSAVDTCRDVDNDLRFLFEIRNFFGLPNSQCALELYQVNLQEAIKQIDFLL
uniref:Cullin domain-containing protein n=1 Tax=Mesocestoides corti TaxID=53468 RepID=A0A5K3FH34_MESCO